MSREIGYQLMNGFGEVNNWLRCLLGKLFVIKGARVLRFGWIKVCCGNYWRLLINVKREKHQ